MSRSSSVNTLFTVCFVCFGLYWIRSSPLCLSVSGLQTRRGPSCSLRLCPSIGRGAFAASVDAAFCGFRGRRSRVQQVCGDAARPGRAVQRTTVSLNSSSEHTWKKFNNRQTEKTTNGSTQSLHAGGGGSSLKETWAGSTTQNTLNNKTCILKLKVNIESNKMHCIHKWYIFKRLQRFKTLLAVASHTSLTTLWCRI